jgi:hypothetical protein
VAQKRLSMRKLREVLRLKHERGLSNRRIGKSLKISHTTVAEYLARATQAGVGWPLPEDWDDDRLEAALFPPTAHATVARPVPGLEPRVPGAGPAQGCDPGAAVARVQAGAPGRVSVQPVL